MAVPAHPAVLRSVGVPAALRFVSVRLVGVGMGMCRAVRMMGVMVPMRMARAGAGMHMEMIVLLAAAVVAHGGDGMVGLGEGGLDLTEVQVASCLQQLQEPAALWTRKIKVIEFEFAADGAVKTASLGV